MEEIGPTGEGPTGASYEDYNYNTKKIKDLDINDIYRSTYGTYYEINKNNIHQLRNYKQVGTLKEPTTKEIYGYVIFDGQDIKVIRYPLSKYQKILQAL